MRRTLVFAAVTVALLGAALALRAKDQPYISYAIGDRASALDGLKRRAEAGDGFAALLVADSVRRTTMGAPALEAAAAWYMTAAKLGEIRAIAPYIQIAMNDATTPAECEVAFDLLDAAGRAREPNALIVLGRSHLTGHCTDHDPAKAAGYFSAAAHLDGRLGETRDAALAQLPPEIAQNVPAIPAKFDLEPRDALTRFLAEAPRLLPTSTDPILH